MKLLLIEVILTINKFDQSGRYFHNSTVDIINKVLSSGWKSSKITFKHKARIKQILKEVAYYTKIEFPAVELKLYFNCGHGWKYILLIGYISAHTTF